MSCTRVLKSRVFSGSLTAKKLHSGRNFCWAYQERPMTTAWFWRFRHHVKALCCPRFMLAELCLTPHAAAEHTWPKWISLQASRSNWSFSRQDLVLFYQDAFLRWMVENSRWCCTQVAAAASNAWLTSFIIYPSCCTGLQEVLLGFSQLVAPWIS